MGRSVALFVRLSLRFAANRSLVPFAVFSENFVSLLPETKQENFSVTQLYEPQAPELAVMVCADAWNADQVCT